MYIHIICGTGHMIIVVATTTIGCDNKICRAREKKVVNSANSRVCCGSLAV